MKISAGASKELVKLIKKENSTSDFLKNKLEIKAKIVGVRGNEITIMFKNGLELKATSNIPLENFLGSQILFRLINSDEGLFLRPKIEGKAMEMEMALKIDDLINKLEILGTKENREIISEMMKQNIPITKNKFEQIKEGIKAFEMISKMTEKDIKNLIKEIDNPNNMELKDVLKRMIAFKEGSNLSDFIQGIKSLNISKEDIMFLFKNDIKLNYENIKTFENFINEKDNIENLSKEFNINISNNKVLDSDSIDNKTIESNFIDNKINQLDYVDKAKTKLSLEEFKDIELKDMNLETISSDENNKSAVSEVIKRQISKLLDEYGKNLQENTKINPEDLKNNLKEIVSLIKALGENLDGKEKESLKSVEGRFSLLEKLSNEYMYLQVPFSNKEYKNMTELIFKEKTEKRGRFKNEKSINILISLNTKNLDRIDTLLVYYKNNLNLAFNFQNENIKKTFEKKQDQIKDAMKAIGFEEITISYKIREENSTLMERLRYSNINDRNIIFDVWV